MYDSDTCSVTRSKCQLKKQKKDSSQQTQTLIQAIKDTHDISTELPVSDTTLIGTVSPRNSNKRWTTDRNPNLPNERDDCY